MKFLHIISLGGLIAAPAAAMHLLKEPDLHRLVHLRDISTLKKFIATKYDLEEHDHYKRTCLHIAIEHRDSETAQILINAGANVNARDSTGRTPLILATLNHDWKMCNILRAKHADDSIVDKYGRKAKDYEPTTIVQIDEEALLIEKSEKTKVIDLPMQQRNNHRYCQCVLQ